MRILHTADWHVGRRLGRHDRAAETAAALEEVARIANEHEVDLVLVAGDVFDRPILRSMRSRSGWPGSFASRRGGPSSRWPAITIPPSSSTRSRHWCGTRAEASI